MESKKIVGLTKNSGYQISISKTFDVSYDIMWDFILAEEGINIWLGKSNMLDFELNTPFKTHTGIAGQLKSFKPGVYFKLTWKAAAWTNISKVEIRIDNKKGKARLGILQSFLTSLDQRSAQKKYWDAIMIQINEELRDLVV